MYSKGTLKISVICWTVKTEPATLKKKCASGPAVITGAPRLGVTGGGRVLGWEVCVLYVRLSKCVSVGWVFAGRGPGRPRGQESVTGARRCLW